MISGALKQPVPLDPEGNVPWARKTEGQRQGTCSLNQVGLPVGKLCEICDIFIFNARKGTVVHDTMGVCWCYSLTHMQMNMYAFMHA